MTTSNRIELTQNRGVALYCRVACKDDNAIAMQKTFLQDYAERQGYLKISFYVDNGVSGINYNRPALAQLKADIQAGLIGAVIVRSFDRIGRDFMKTENWIVGIRRRGVAFISISEGTDDSRFNGAKPLERKFLELYEQYLTAARRKKRRAMRRSG